MFESENFYKRNNDIKKTNMKSKLYINLQTIRQWKNWEQKIE